jgi:hypothetical protein
VFGKGFSGIEGGEPDESGRNNESERNDYYVEKINW